MNFQGYIALFNFQSAAAFLQRLIIYHSLFRLSSEFLKYFWDFLISVSFISSGPCGPQRCETLLNISSIFVLSNYFLKIFWFFSFSRSALPSSSWDAKHHLIYHQILFCQTLFWRFLIFYQPALHCQHFQLTERKTSPNISAFRFLSSSIWIFFDLFLR